MIQIGRLYHTLNILRNRTKLEELVAFPQCGVTDATVKKSIQKDMHFPSCKVF